MAAHARSIRGTLELATDLIERKTIVITKLDDSSVQFRQQSHSRDQKRDVFAVHRPSIGFRLRVPIR